jgi:hypothetical protein
LIISKESLSHLGGKEGVYNGVGAFGGRLGALLPPTKRRIKKVSF